MRYEYHGGVGREPPAFVAAPEPVYGKDPAVSSCEQLTLVLGIVEPLPQHCAATYPFKTRPLKPSKATEATEMRLSISSEVWYDALST